MRNRYRRQVPPCTSDKPHWPVRQKHAGSPTASRTRCTVAPYGSRTRVNQTSLRRQVLYGKPDPMGGTSTATKLGFSPRRRAADAIGKPKPIVEVASSQAVSDPFQQDWLGVKGTFSFSPATLETTACYSLRHGNRVRDVRQHAGATPPPLVLGSPEQQGVVGPFDARAPVQSMKR